MWERKSDTPGVSEIYYIISDTAGSREVLLHYNFHNSEVVLQKLHDKISKIWRRLEDTVGKKPCMVRLGGR